jgi:dipeptidyl aminopeptidase/acylaminoacyl peptidase
MPEAAAYGSWRSPITAALIAAGAVPLGGAELLGDDTYWVEGKPLEGGRYVLVRQAKNDTPRELTPPGFNVRTRVHEYGGGAYTLHDRTVFFSNFADQRLYRQDDAGEPRPITPEPEIPAGGRYADGQVTADGRLLICVRELHAGQGREAVNELVVIPTDGSAPPRPIVGGHDFFSAPRISPDGKQLAWQTWDHPRMPWDGSELWVGDLAPDGSVSNAKHLAGGAEESIFQPAWSPAGVLHVVSDRTGWWNLYRVDDTRLVPLHPMEAEFGVAQWVFGLGTYAFLADGRIVCRYSQHGIDHLAYLTPDGQKLEDADLPYTLFGARLSVQGNQVTFVGASPTEPTSVVVLDTQTGERAVLRRSIQHELDPAYLSRPRPIEFPTAGGTAYALYYPPTNPNYAGPAGERPPLLVESHGGPTAMAHAELSLDIQFWTSRGFAVVDVNYGGSSGFGRAYRERLKGQWGVVDTQDCINAARYLAQQGEVDGRRLAIRGGSAGGYTTLCGLVFHDDFAAGASYYGVADCEALATDTHKFESRYLDGLIGPYPEAREVYRARSPIHFADRLSCPVILFQGLEDRVVPPSQAEEMVRALRAKGLPFAYLAFEGEQHGFRQASTIQRTLEAELYFYARVFDFPLADQIEPVPIENLPGQAARITPTGS